MEGVGEPQNVNLGVKVSCDKILELRTVNLYSESEEHQILDIKNCQNLAEAQIAMATTCLESFPNIFVIIVDVLSLKNEELETFLKFLLKKIPKNREMFLQIHLSEWQVHHKAKNAEKFIKLDLSSDVDLFLKRFKLNKKLEAKNFFEILKFRNCSLIDADFNLILNFISINDKFVLIKNAIKAKDELLVKLLMLFVTEMSEQLLDEALKAKSVDILILILNNFTVNAVSEEQVSKILNHELRDELLIKIAGENHFKILQVLIRNQEIFSKFLNHETWCKAIKSARDGIFYEFYSVLQIFEYKFYKETIAVGVDKLDSDQIPSLNNIQEMHSCIESGNLRKVQEIAKDFPNFKYFFNSKSETAIEKALSCKNFEIYAFLMSEGFLVYNNANFKSFESELNEVEKKKLQNEILKAARKNPDNFIYILMTKIDLSMGAIDLSFNQIREMVEKLKEREENREVMRIASQAEVQIIFDFITKSVNRMDPNCDEHTMGSAYFSKGELYVGKNANKNQRYGTFAHEMMHFVLYLVFENGCLPYCKGDTVREAEWAAVFEKVKREYENNTQTTDNIIKWVFTCYTDEDKDHEIYLQSAELAVRVNDMMGFYHDNDEKIKELEGLHPELFSYIREKVLPDLKIPNVYRMIKLNNEFGLIQKIEDSKLQVNPTEISEILNLAQHSKKVLIVTNVPQLMLSKISQEIRNLPQTNKLNVKARNIFVNLKVLDQKHVKDEFEALIETTNIDRIISDSTDFKSILNNLKTEISCFIVTNEGLSEDQALELNLNRTEFNIQWQHLTKETQDFLLEMPIKFQENALKLSEILSDAENSITPEILAILCSDSEIKVNCDLNVEKFEQFIERTVQVKKEIINQDKKGSELIYEDFSLKDFATQSDPILVISDVAGSGKTTLLSKIHEILMQSFPQYFIIFISLLKYVEALKEGVGGSFTDFIAKILSFNALEEEIFMQKYSTGEVKILFDAFDEISPNCKGNTTKLLQLFDKTSKNQVFITTRTHLEHDLERDLKILAHKIKILTEEEQVKFLEESWENSDRELVKKCAKMLVRKIYDIISSKPSLIGVPLIVRGLAEAFKSRINENFEREIQFLDILSVYEKIIEISFDILSSRFPQKPVKNQKKSINPLQLHQFLAICLLFSEEFANLLGFNHDEDEWPFEEIARCGLIKYDKDRKFHFIHQTFAEFFIAVFIFHLLKTVKKLSPIQLDFIFQVLTKRNFYITREFLDSMLNRVEKVQDLKCFNSSHEICERVKTDKHFLDFCMHEKLFHVFEFFALAVKESDVDLFKEVIEYRDNRTVPILMRILPRATNLTKFEKFLDEILSFYSENVFGDFLLKADGSGDTILHYFAEECKSREVFKCFWNKIEVFFVDEVKLRVFLFVKKGDFKRNALLLSIMHQNENSFCFLLEEVYCKFFNVKEIAYVTDETYKDGQNILHDLAKLGSVSMLKIVLEKLKKEFSPEEFQDFVKLKSKFGKNILHHAAQNKNENSVEFLVSFIANEFGIEGVIKMLSELDDIKQLPLHYAFSCKNLKHFEFFFSLYRQNFSSEQIFEFLPAKNSFSRSKGVFAFKKIESWTKIENLIEDEDKLKQLLLAKNNKERNALLQSILYLNKDIFYFLFEKVYCKYFNVKEFAHETDESGKNLLHFLAEDGPVSMLKFALEKLKTEISPEEFRDFVKLRSKDNQNLLHFAALNSNQESVKFLVNFIENEVGSEDFKKMLSELDNSKSLPLHYAVTSWNSQVFGFFFSLCEKNFNFDELKAFLTSINDRNENFFTLIRKMNLTFRKPEHSEWKKILDEYREANIDIKTDSDVNIVKLSNI